MSAAAGDWRERMLDRRDRRRDAALWAACDEGGVVAAAHFLATRAGARVLAKGGDAVDAAIACSLALGVVEPAGSGLGGMAMMIVYRADEQRTYGLAGPCRAPATATPELVRQARSRYRGYRAVATPGLPAVLEAAFSRWGRRPLGDLVEPAVEAARDGVAVTPLQHWLIRQCRGPLYRHSAGALFLDDRNPHPVGRVLSNPTLAKTLEQLALAGFRDFYEGRIAERIDRDMRAHGGFLRASDLAAYPRPEPIEHLTGRFDPWTIQTLGPPAGGVALVQTLQTYDAAANDPAAHAQGEEVLMARSIRAARRDRRRFRRSVGAESLGEAEDLISVEHARQVAAQIAGETSHISVADRWGNLAALTQSLDRSFGAAEIAGDLGFLYNGFLRAFKIEARGHPHYLRPAVAARSNAAPTIVLDESGRGIGALGSTGSERIASAMLATLRALRAGDEPFESVAAPRLHADPKGRVELEAERFPTAALDALREAGFTLEAWGPWAFKAGGLQLVWRTAEGWTGVADPRRDGWACGPSQIPVVA